MLHLEALKRLKVTSVKLEVVASMISGTSHQVRLTGISEPLSNGNRVAAIDVFPGGPPTLLRMLRSGLFQASIGQTQADFDLLWQACTMPHEYFNASLVLKDAITPDGEYQEVDLAFTYEIGRGKPAFEGLPSDDWIR